MTRFYFLFQQYDSFWGKQSNWLFDTFFWPIAFRQIDVFFNTFFNLLPFDKTTLLEKNLFVTFLDLLFFFCMELRGSKNCFDCKKTILF